MRIRRIWLGIVVVAVSATACTQGANGDASSAARSAGVTPSAAAVHGSSGAPTISPRSDAAGSRQPSIAPATNSAFGSAPAATVNAPAPPTVSATGDLLAIVVAGAGSSSSAVTVARCSAEAITGQVGGGSLTLNLSSNALHLQNVSPIGTIDFTGALSRHGSTVRYTGSATGTSVTLQVAC